MLSVVVPTFNRAHSLGSTLKSLLAQETDYPYEVIVVDNNSSDETESVVRVLERTMHGRLWYVFERPQGLSAARNAGLTAARGEIIAFLDDDVIAPPTWAEALVEVYRAHPDAWGVGGKIIIHPPAVCPRWFDQTSPVFTAYLSGVDLGDNTIRLKPPFKIYGANFSVRRDVFSSVGVFKSQFGRIGACLLGYEETELCFRIHQAGGGIYYCGRAAVTHIVPPERVEKSYFREKAYWAGRSAALFASHHFPHGVWKGVVRSGARMVKHWGRMIGHLAARDARSTFEHELTTWFCLGYVRQALSLHREPRPHQHSPTTAMWSASEKAPDERGA